MPLTIGRNGKNTDIIDIRFYLFPYLFTLMYNTDISTKKYHISTNIYRPVHKPHPQLLFCRACSIFLRTWLQFNVSSACVIFSLSSLSLKSSLSSFLSSKSLSRGSLPSNPQLCRNRWLSIRRASLACFVLDKMSLFWKSLKKNIYKTFQNNWSALLNLCFVKI